MTVPFTSTGMHRPHREKWHRVFARGVNQVADKSIFATTILADNPSSHDRGFPDDLGREVRRANLPAATGNLRGTLLSSLGIASAWTT
jgi:hypothetical protein